MKKTGSQIETDIYKLIKSSVLATAITGKVYRGETRPQDSQLEDCVVIFITALDGKNQMGTVSINVYVADSFYGETFVRNSKRCTELEIVCQTFVESLPTNNYLFSLGNMIQTFDEADINQHFINVKLNFKYNTLN